ncbi:MAG TPA: hypothetical protein DD414_07040 [Lachnospiraceae bacterium]|nr:hypothetical protein [Lachnospiraceae bacterium]
MDRLFNPDNPFWLGMGKIFDIFVLNTLWLLCCLPVFTIGPATTALFYAMIHLVRDEGFPVTQDFFRSFKQNFRQGILLGIPLTLTGAFLMADVWMCYRAGTGVYTFFMVFFAVMFLLWSFITLYAFPVLAKFEKSNKEILIWAFTLSIQHIGLTILMLFVLAFGLWVCHILPGLIFIVFGLVCEFQSVLIASVFKPWLPDVHAGESMEPLSFILEDEEKEHEE